MQLGPGRQVPDDRSGIIGPSDDVFAVSGDRHTVYGLTLKISVYILG